MRFVLYVTSEFTGGSELYLCGLTTDQLPKLTRDARNAIPFLTAREAYQWAQYVPTLQRYRAGKRAEAGIHHGKQRPTGIPTIMAEGVLTA